MRRLLTPVAVVLLSIFVAACGGTTKAKSSAFQPSSTTSTATSATTTASTAQSSHPSQDDNHIATYGNAATEPDKREITGLIKRYYAAAGADDGAAACPLIYSPIARSVPEDYGRPPGPLITRGNTCTVVMSKSFKHIPNQSLAVLATTKVTGIRLNPDGNEGFVQLSSKTMPTGEIFVQREGHSWKVGALIGRACADCAAG